MSATAPALHRSFLVWRNGLYAKLAALVGLVAIALYWLAPSAKPAYGGTVLGYTLGTAGLLLIAWLAWFGIRRKRYGGSGSLEELLSAHVYFGLALVVLATLHTGFRFHWNVHTFAFVLMVAVVASGIFGAYAFWRYPSLMTANRAGAQLDQMSASLAALDLRCQNLALSFPDDIVTLVHRATLQEGRSAPDGTATLAAIARVQQELGQLAGPSSAEVIGLVQALTTRVALLDRLSRDRRYRALMLLWRAVHVPLTLGLLVALFIHVFAVFYYW